MTRVNDSEKRGIQWIFSGHFMQLCVIVLSVDVLATQLGSERSSPLLRTNTNKILTFNTHTPSQTNKHLHGSHRKFFGKKRRRKDENNHKSHSTSCFALIGLTYTHRPHTSILGDGGKKPEAALVLYPSNEAALFHPAHTFVVIVSQQTSLQAFVWSGIHTHTHYAIFRRLYHFGAKNQRIFFPFIYAYTHRATSHRHQYFNGQRWSFYYEKCKKNIPKRKQKRVTTTDQTTQHFVYFNVLMLSNGLRRFLFRQAEHTWNTMPFARRNSAIDFIILAWFRNVSNWKGRTACSEWKYRRKNIWV